MSGRKDYSYELVAARIAAQQAAVTARRAERAQQTRERLEAARSEAQRRASELATQQRAFNQKQRKLASDQNKREVEMLSREIKTNAKEIRNAPTNTGITLKRNLPPIAKSLESDPIGFDPDNLAKEAADLKLQDQIETQLKIVLQWQANFTNNSNVQSFTAKELSEWRIASEKIVAEISNSPSSIETLSRLQHATSQAEQLELKAGEVSDKFFSRNAVLTDIIASLMEIGFFVQDPEFYDANDPAGSVIIRANRGNQSLSTSVSLEQKVESDWQGVHGEYCTGGFFEFVQAMDQRGVIINPENFDLKPQLLQKGAKDLPGAQRKTAGENQ